MTAEQQAEQKPTEASEDDHSEDEYPDDYVEASEQADEYDHLEEVPDGSGCTEIWEHLSDERDDDE